MKKILSIAIAIALCSASAYASGSGNKSAETDPAIKNLYSKSAGVRADARRKLCKLAKESVQDKIIIVNKVSDMLRDPHLFNSAGGWAIWYDGAYLLGDLKAEEAIDVLVEHLDYNNGMGFSLGHVPAAWALTEIGAPAVPKLKQALLWSPNPNIRQNAARALMKIGGAEADQAVKAALMTETDEIVLFYLSK